MSGCFGTQNLSMENIDKSSQSQGLEFRLAYKSICQSRTVFGCMLVLKNCGGDECVFREL